MQKGKTLGNTSEKFISIGSGIRLNILSYFPILLPFGYRRREFSDSIRNTDKGKNVVMLQLSPD